MLRRWRAGDTAARTGFAGYPGEIGRLGAELDRMMDEIAKAEEDKQLLSGELLHRVRNTLSMVSAIASGTLNRPAPGHQLLPDYLGRIGALAQSHRMLTGGRLEDAELEALIRAVVSPLVPDDRNRVSLAGPSIRLNARDALSMTLVMHELTTNALKYGSLGAREGRVAITWTLDGQTLDVVWAESGGPPVVVGSERRGFGTRLMSRAFGPSGTVVLAFPETGAHCRITLDLSDAGMDPAVPLRTTPPEQSAK